MVEHGAPPSIAARDVAADAFILDVREADEWADGHAPGSLHMPMHTVPERLAELPRERQITVLCAVGVRSAHVTAWLVGQGFDAVNVDGGIHAWVYADRTVEVG